MLVDSTAPLRARAGAGPGRPGGHPAPPWRRPPSRSCASRGPENVPGEFYAGTTPASVRARFRPTNVPTLEAGCGLTHMLKGCSCQAGTFQASCGPWGRAFPKYAITCSPPTVERWCGSQTATPAAGMAPLSSSGRTNSRPCLRSLRPPRSAFRHMLL